MTDRYVQIPADANPLGGREADGFDRWLRSTHESIRAAWEAVRDTSAAPDNVLRYMACSAARDYGLVLEEWEDVKAGRGRMVRGDLTRDRFERTLLALVVTTHGAARSAVESGHEAGGRPLPDITGAYLRACIIFAQYVGVSEVIVAECGDDQGKLSALRAAPGGSE